MALFDAERKWIAAMGTFAPNGYNMTLGGEGGFGMKMSDDNKRNVSKRFKGKKQSPEHIEKCRAKRIGLKRSEETRKRIGQTRRGKKLSEAQIEMMRVRRIGVPLTECARQKISRPVVADGKEFKSLGDAAKELNVAAETISRRIMRGVPGYTSLVGITRPGVAYRIKIGRDGYSLAA